MFNKLRYAIYMTKAEKLIKKGVSLDDERMKHYKEQIGKALRGKKRGA